MKNSQTCSCPDRVQQNNTTKFTQFEMASLCDYRSAMDSRAIYKRSEYFQILWVKKGSGKYIPDDALNAAGDNMVFCLAPHQMQIPDLSTASSGTVLSFSSDFLDFNPNSLNPLLQSPAFRSGTNAVSIPISNEIGTELDILVSNMVREQQHGSILKTEILREYLKIFMMYLNRQIVSLNRVPDIKMAQTNAYSSTRLTNSFLELLHKRRDNKKLVIDYAKMLAVTPNYLNSMVKRTTGKTVSYHINAVIVSEAKRQAIYTDKSMKEIAYDLGFDETSHFSKFFKNISGLSFSEYRKSACEEIFC